MRCPTVSAEPFAALIVARPVLASQGRFRAWEHLSIRVHDFFGAWRRTVCSESVQEKACWVAPWFARVVHSLGLLVSGLCFQSQMSCGMW